METIALKFPPGVHFSDDELYAFCLANDTLKIERNEKGELIIMSLTGGKTGIKNTAIVAQIWIWNSQTKAGRVFDSSTGFRLPDGSMHSPDAAWVTEARWQELSEEQKEKFPPLCPDFVVELSSSTDNLADAKEKMEKWMQNGCRLAWLFDTRQQKVHIYRADGPTEEINGFQNSISGENVLPDFSFALHLLV
jgi:Uma2 family endonuclease